MKITHYTGRKWNKDHLGGTYMSLINGENWCSCQRSKKKERKKKKILFLIVVLLHVLLDHLRLVCEPGINNKNSFSFRMMSWEFLFIFSFLRLSLGRFVEISITPGLRPLLIKHREVGDWDEQVVPVQISWSHCFDHLSPNKSFGR